jgi:hypothetical protein
MDKAAAHSEARSAPFPEKRSLRTLPCATPAWTAETMRGCCSREPLGGRTARPRGPRASAKALRARDEPLEPSERVLNQDLLAVPPDRPLLSYVESDTARP